MLARLRHDPFPVVHRQGGLREQRHLRRVGNCRKHRVDVVLVLDESHRVGCDRQGASGFVVALMADVQDGETLVRAHLRLVMDLGDERAHRVHHEPVLGTCRGHDLGRGAVRRQHEGRALGHVIDVVDEDHALLSEAVDDESVVDDLVVAVDGWLEQLEHRRQRLDRHLHARAEPARLGEEHTLHRHAPRVLVEI